jgi:hypothetical protein
MGLRQFGRYIMEGFSLQQGSITGSNIIKTIQHNPSPNDQGPLG